MASDVSGLHFVIAAYMDSRFRSASIGIVDAAAVANGSALCSPIV